MEIVIDATNATLGRLASYAAKQALLGHKIIIVNSEKAIITGKKETTSENYRIKKARGGSSQRGPFFPKSPERIVKRTIRGMLPNYREGRGREAFKRILCYKGIPEEYKDKKLIKAGKQKTTSYMTIQDITKKI
jgi:large subunit ribosomal protein L13